jgi:hypothetical protein
MEDPLLVEEEAQSGSKTSTHGLSADAAEPVPRKPGSKAQGRKRTKTGCLSKSQTPRSLLIRSKKCS